MQLTSNQENALKQLRKIVAQITKPWYKKFSNFSSRVRLKNIYLHGQAGAGKTTVIDIFFERMIEENFEDKVMYMHCSDYMMDISKLLQVYKMSELCHKISKKISIICFDEFYIESISDARIIQDLVTSLNYRGISLVITSNFKPEDLYKDGINRGSIFPKFSDYLKKKFYVLDMNCNKDFRDSDEKISGQIFLHPSEIKSNIVFLPKNITFKHSQEIYAKHAEDGHAIFEHYELFRKHKDGADYVYIARNYQLISIENVPQFNKDNEDEAIRFRNFIDIIYERNVNILIYSKQTIDTLFSSELSQKVEFLRTLSRLKEMNWVKYIHSNSHKIKRTWSEKTRVIFDKLIEDID